MEYITTTELRTKSSALIRALEKGNRVSLIHRSKIVGKITPVQEAKPFDAEAFRRLIKDIKPKKLIPREKRETIYRKQLEEKYGKDIS